MNKYGTTENTRHPGEFVRLEVIPKGMTVTRAAELIGVGRPALSNFLNGRAALSQEMALRLERTFEADREVLLDLQAKYDRRDEAVDTPVVAGRHAPTLVQIKAREVEKWADTTAAREELPALLRRLVCSTGDQLARVDFPAFENAQRPGWDGEVELAIPTPWIPAGHSGWEFGCDSRPASKANEDYTKRVRAFPSGERRERTFVFVTPRNWQGKDKWAEEKAALGEWNDVRAYDASDLEQWLEQSAETQVWFSERLGNPVDGFRSPEMCWSDWAEVCEPGLSPALFSVTDDAIDDFQRWLSTTPERNFIVTADSPEEALAFACHLVRKTKLDTASHGAGALVFDTPKAIQQFRATNTAPRIAIIHDTGVESEIGDLYRSCHIIITRPANDVDVEPDILLRLPSRQHLSEALTSMEIDEDRIDRLIRESGRSPAVLRRRLSKVPAIREPAWVGNPQIARKLLPAALVGAWSKASSADLEVVRRLVRTDDNNVVEVHVMELLNIQDSPLWARGDYRGVVSRIDALFGIAKFVTGTDLEMFFAEAERVLGETDPALDLPENERWAAALYGKERAHSAALRQNIREMLVILAIHGNHLYQSRLGMNIERMVSSLIHRLLTPLTLEILLSHQDDLPDYAEAAPDGFLKIVEEDLKSPNPVVYGLLKPVDNSVFGNCPRTGLLWALECLAWKQPSRVSLILAKMARIPINDNWTHKPLNSLQEIYRSWIPQTAVSLEDRVRGLELLADRYPDVGWKVCVAQFDTGPKFATPGYRPRRRDDADGEGYITAQTQIDEFRFRVLDIIGQCPNHDHRTLGDLVVRLHGFSDEYQSEIWDMIDAWAATAVDDTDRSELRAQIRKNVLSRTVRKRTITMVSRTRALKAYDLLKPQDKVLQHAWLFADSWIELPIDEFEDADNFTVEYKEVVRKLRSSAIGEIWAERGFQGICAVLSNCSAPIVVGESLRQQIVNLEARVIFLRGCITYTELADKFDLCVQGFLWSIGEENRAEVLLSASQDFAPDQVVRLFRCAPCCWHTWRLLDRYGNEIRNRYWKAVIPDTAFFAESESTEFINYMLEANRPRAAFRYIRFNLGTTSTSQLKRLLMGLVREDTESTDSHLYQLDSHDLSEAIEELNGRVEIDRPEMARLEFSFIQQLSWSEYGIPNLERMVAESPIDFVRFLAMAYKRKDEGQDPLEWNPIDADIRSELAMAASRFLDCMSYIPGTRVDGNIDEGFLSRWIAETRRLCAEYGRQVAGDEHIGQILARGPEDEYGVKPCREISLAMEKVGSRELSSGFVLGVLNSLGATARFLYEGGVQERELAETFRDWAAQRSPAFPYVGGMLEDIANYYERKAQRVDEEAEIAQRLEL